MPYKRVHSNGFEVVIDADLTEDDRWMVRFTFGPKDLTLLGVKTPSLEMVKELSDSVAGVDHRCNPKCENWKAVLI